MDGVFEDIVTDGKNLSMRVREVECGVPIKIEPRYFRRHFPCLSPFPSSRWRDLGRSGGLLHDGRNHSPPDLFDGRQNGQVHLSRIVWTLGHSTYQITADIYTHVAPEQKQVAADAIDDTSGGG